MKKTIKNLALILMLVVAFSCVAMQASAADASVLSFADCEGGVMVTYCDETASGELSIPAQHDNKNVVAIGNGAFENCIALTKVVMPDTVKSVGDNAFAGCTALADVTFAYGLEKIGADAFFACDALKNVVLYPGLKEMGQCAFYDCESLESVVIPSGFVNIPEGAFGECAKLTTISLPLTVRSIDVDAFVNCAEIKTVYFEGNELAWYGIKWGEGNDTLFETSRKNFLHLHDYTQTVIKAPACVDLGITKFVCGCGYTYIDSKVPAVGHKAEKIDEIKATCVDTGKTAGEKCSVCGIILTAPQTIPATGHGTAVILEAKQATCKESGLTEGSYCSICTETIVAQQVIEKLPHTYDKSKVTPATFSDNGKIEGFCTVCNEQAPEDILAVTDVKLSQTSYVYNGKARKPAVTVKDSSGKELVEKTDYTLTYAKGRKNAGTYTVKVVLQGNYSGTKTLSFNILPSKAEALKAKPASKTSAKITWNEVPGATGYRIYIFKSADSTTKKKIDPATSNSYVLKKDYNGKALVMGKTYKISVTPYVKNSDGKYIFAEEATVIKFKFAPVAPTLKVTSTAKGKATLDWSNVAAETGYQVYMSTDGKKFTKYATFKGWPDKQTFSGLKAGKKYYFKVRAYTAVDSKTTVYGSYSAVKSVTIKK